MQNAVLLLFANEMLLTSFYACGIMVILGMILFVPSFSMNHNEGLKLKSMIFHAILIVSGTLILRLAISTLIGSKSDVSSFYSFNLVFLGLDYFYFLQAHIFNLLKSKLTSYRDFHTLLYICAAEFDFLSTTTLYQLSSTLLLPSVYMSLGLVALYAMGLLENVPVPKRHVAPSKKTREPRKEKEVKKEVVSELRKVDPAVLYNVLQLAAFVIMTSLFMRLKLFMSPHLCLTAALLASRKVTSTD